MELNTNMARGVNVSHPCQAALLVPLVLWWGLDRTQLCVMLCDVVPATATFSITMLQPINVTHLRDASSHPCVNL